ncbi:hypothetical protein K0M31_003066 [Melipona bicolor]|uniref:Uncharacterized protein n=1 Tax=Melipona bicolor TaxID=60889 RepID=A0AA40KQ36_9HYME|nr:hypothetical protein K0M31_003066 [Melipona bicolor]
MHSAAIQLCHGLDQRVANVLSPRVQEANPVERRKSSKKKRSTRRKKKKEKLREYRFLRRVIRRVVRFFRRGDRPVSCSSRQRERGYEEEDYDGKACVARERRFQSKKGPAYSSAPRIPPVVSAGLGATEPLRGSTIRRASGSQPTDSTSGGGVSQPRLGFTLGFACRPVKTGDKVRTKAKVKKEKPTRRRTTS